MVRLAVAGGTGNVATSLLKPAIASGLHDITILTRSQPKHPIPGVTYQTVSYTDLPGLTSLLTGTHTVLSFLIAHLDPSNTAQKNLIHASISAGVSRFAPSEWGIASNSAIAAYANKDAVSSYLKELDEKGELGGMQYCLFQPSIFMDYFAHPNSLEEDLITWPFFVDFETRRAIVLDDGKQEIVITCIQDDAQILHKALCDERPWPRVGGIRGCRTTIAELLSLGQKIRGGEWKVETVRAQDVADGVLKTSWVPRMAHPVIPLEEQEKYSSQFVCEFLNEVHRGTWDVSDEWNRRFPEYKFTSAEEYLTKAWKGKP